jgi:hypothetical protein
MGFDLRRHPPLSLLKNFQQHNLHLIVEGVLQEECLPQIHSNQSSGNLEGASSFHGQCVGRH